MIGCTTDEIEVISLLVSFLSKYTTRAEFEEHKKEYEELLKRLEQLEANSKLIQCDVITSGRKKAGTHINLPVVDGKQVGYKSNSYGLVVSADGKTLANGYEFSEVAGEKANRILLNEDYPKGTHFHFIIHGWTLADTPPAEEETEDTGIFGDTETEFELGVYGILLNDDGTVQEAEASLEATIV